MIEKAYCWDCGKAFEYEWTGHRRRRHCDACRTPGARMRRQRDATRDKSLKNYYRDRKKPALKLGKRDTFIMPLPGPVEVFNVMAKLAT